MEKRKVLLAVPSHSGNPSEQTKATVGCIRLECAGLGWDLEELIWARDSLIVHARNVIAAKFKHGDYTDLFCLDDDVGFGPGVFTRMMMHRVDFVAGIYRAKCEDVKYFVRWLPEQGEIWADPATGLIEAQDVPFGCVRIARAAIEKMVAANEDRWFHAHDAEGLKCWELFQTELRDHELNGEDFFFCRKYREAGGRVWIDPELPIVHVASPVPGMHDAVLYHGHFGNFLRGRIQ